MILSDFDRSWHVCVSVSYCLPQTRRQMRPPPFIALLAYHLSAPYAAERYRRRRYAFALSHADLVQDCQDLCLEGGEEKREGED
jgi:hypothetical protein